MARERDAFDAALAALRRRERTGAELRAWLDERGYEATEVERALELLGECGEIDDERFARRFAEDKRELAGWGPERIEAALLERGLDRALVEQVSADDHATQVARATGVLRARGVQLADDGDRRRALGLLRRRGYDGEVAYEAIRTAERAA